MVQYYLGQWLCLDSHALSTRGAMLSGPVAVLDSHALSTRGAILSGPVAVLGFTRLKYSWCNVIWVSGFVGIHTLKRTPNFVLACIEPLKVILLSRRSVQI